MAIIGCAGFLKSMLACGTCHHERVVGMRRGVRSVVHHALDVAFLEFPGVESFDYSERHDQAPCAEPRARLRPFTLPTVAPRPLRRVESGMLTPGTLT